MQLKTLIDLAKNQNGEKEKVLSSVSPALHKYVAEELAYQQEVREREAAREIVQYVEKVNLVIEDHKEHLANLRRAEKDVKAQLNKLSRARDYGNQTCNYLPMLDAINALSSSAKREIPPELLVVPKE